MSARPIIVIAGIGNGSGTGGATARVFSKAGYRVALIARGADRLQKAANDINKAGGEAVAFPVESYTYKSLTDVFGTIRTHKWSGTSSTPEIRAAVWNAGAGVWKGFLDVTEEDLQLVVDTNINGAFAFAHQVLQAFKQNEVDELGKRGTLIFTGATASIRGNVTTSAFAAGKFALRALSQSLNKEFGRQNIHVAHAIIDGGILTDLSLSRRTDEAAAKAFKEDANIRLDPESIAKSYLYLANQDRSAWTWELDLRPAHEKW
ncbi:short-chain dehydrogenase/reductase SDR [Pilatotrama ljubarskyi]|nr:short-chain dehydrogenase/reductase SDR [Pilatotrama ljubarskyi]